MKTVNWEYNNCSKDDHVEVDSTIYNILKNRNVEDIEKFLEPSINDIRDPFSFKDMEKVVERISFAIKNDEKITIFGDYDVDGVSSTAFAIICFREINKDVNYYIPSREDGYGLDKNVIKRLKEEGTDLIITVDCGINALDEISFAKEIGLDVIVTDHHIISTSLPDAIGVINPRREENKLPNISGSGTIFMVFYALFKYLGIDNKIIIKYLDLVSLGTISDFMPLTHDNRIFVKYGLEILKNSSILGLNLLASKVFKDYEEINTKDVSFKLIPIINAAGRIAKPNIIVDLFIEKNLVLCESLVENLINLNKDRQEISKLAFQEAEKDLSNNLSNVLISYSENYHKGIIGIISSKITEKYKKPSIIISVKDDIATGSARSSNINILECIEKAKNFLIKSGGHNQAAGFSLKKENLEKFKFVLENYVNNLDVKVDDSLKIDSELYDFKLNLEFYNLLKKMKPYGKGNEEPVFAIKAIKIKNIRLIGSKSNHIMFDIYNLNFSMKNCVWFNSVTNFEMLNENSFYDLAFKMDENIYNNKTYLKLFVEDIKLNTESINFYEYYKKLKAIIFPIKTKIYLNSSNLAIGDILSFEKNGVGIFKNGKIVGFLKEDISYILKELNKHFNFKFKINVTAIDNISKYISMEIVKDYIVKESDMKSMLIEIKDNLIGNYNYNKMQKDVLKKVIFEEKSVILVSKKGRGIGTLVLAIGMYFKYIKKQKCLYITSKDKSARIRDLYTISKEFIEKEHDSYSFVFFEDNFKECNTRYLFFTEEVIENKNVFEDNFNIPENLVILKEKCEEIYSNDLIKEEKDKIIEKLKKGEKVKADRTILAVLD